MNWVFAAMLRVNLLGITTCDEIVMPLLHWQAPSCQATDCYAASDWCWMMHWTESVHHESPLCPASAILNAIILQYR